MPRPADRGADQERPTEKSQSSEEPKKYTEPRSTRASSRPVESESKLKKPWVIGVIIIVVILLVGVVGWSLTRSGSNGGGVGSSSIDIDSGKYQAVFFTNGQVYFGKLHTFNNDYMELTDIFYLQTQSDSSNPQKTSSDSNSDVQLVKLGNEIHGPEDKMVIAKNQVLFFENLKADGKVAQSIASYQKK